MNVGDHYGDVPFCSFVVVVVVPVSIVVVVGVNVGLIVVEEFVVPLVQSPFWKPESL